MRGLQDDKTSLSARYEGEIVMDATFTTSVIRDVPGRRPSMQDGVQRSHNQRERERARGPSTGDRRMPSAYGRAKRSRERAGAPPSNDVRSTARQNVLTSPALT